MQRTTKEGDKGTQRLKEVREARSQMGTGKLFRGRSQARARDVELERMERQRSPTPAWETRGRRRSSSSRRSSLQCDIDREREEIVREEDREIEKWWEDMERKNKSKKIGESGDESTQSTSREARMSVQREKETEERNKNPRAARKEEKQYTKETGCENYQRHMEKVRARSVSRARSVGRTQVVSERAWEDQMDISGDSSRGRGERRGRSTTRATAAEGIAEKVEKETCSGEIMTERRSFPDN